MFQPQDMEGPALRAALRAMEALPAELRDRLLPPVVVDGQTLDWRWRLTLRLQEVAQPVWWHFPVPTVRRLFARSMQVLCPPDIGDVTVTQTELPGAEGPRPARHYTTGGGAGTLLFLHGGGFVIGDPATHDAPCKLLARHGLDVISLDYRLAPEHPFPAAVDDCLAAARHLLALGPIGIGGDSAGGNLSTVVCNELLWAGEPCPSAQLLYYLAVDMPNRYPSDDLFGQGFGLDRLFVDWFYAHTFLQPGDPADRRCSPLLHPVAAGMPPAFVSVAGFDPLRDQGRAWAAALEAAQCDVMLSEHPDQIHGFINAVDAMPAANDATSAGARWLVERLAPTED